VTPERTLQPGPWLKTPGWRGGSFLVGMTLLLLLVDWITGDAVDLGLARPLAVLVLGFLMSVPYGWAWVHGRAPLPPKDPDVLPQAHIEGERGSTYVIVAPTARTGLGRGIRARELTPFWWLLYTVFWRWPLLVGDAALSVAWRGLTRLFGFNGGPRLRDYAPNQVDRPESFSPPDRDTF
jgi:hypothetical protein